MSVTRRSFIKGAAAGGGAAALGMPMVFSAQYRCGCTVD